MNRFMWLTLPISVALFTACGSSTDPVAPLTPEQVSLLATQTTIELPAGGQVSKTFTLTNTSASEISYSSSVAFPNGTPSWLTLTAGQSGKIAPSANQVVTFTATCPNVAVTSQYTAVIALAVASGDVSLTKTTTATLKCIVTPPVSSPDTTRPVLSLQALTTTTSNQVTVTGTASDNVAVTRVAYSLNGGASTDVAIQAGASVPLSFTVGGLAVGSNTITVTAYDAAGLVSDVSTLTVTSAPVVADTSKPVLSVQAPTSTELDQVTVTGTATDDVAVTRVAYSLNGGASTDVAIQAGASVPLSFTVSGLRVGSNTITVTAYDAAGLVSDVSTLTVTSAPVVIVPDTTRPVLSLHAPTTTGSNQVTVTGTASDNVAVTRVAYSLNGGASADVAIQAGASVPLSFTVGGLAVGSNTVTVTAYDAAGLVSDVSTLTVTSAPDTIAPVVTVTAPLYSGGTFDINGVVTDAGGLAQGGVTYSLLDSTNTEVDSDVLTLDAGGNYLVPLVGLAQDNYTLVVTAIDQAGNTGSSQATFSVDTTVPALSLTSVVPNANSFTATGLASDALSGLAAVTYAVTDISNTVVKSGSVTVQPNGSYTFNAADFADGTYTVMVTATDVAGNSSSASRTLFLSQNGPVISLNGTAPNNGTFTFSGTVTDIDLDPASVVFALKDSSGQTIRSGSLTLTGSAFSQAISGLTEGRYELSITAKDTSNNVNTSTLITVVTVDKTLPVITNFTSTVQRKGRNAKVVLTFKATDDIGVAKVEYQAGSGNFKTVVLSSTGNYRVTFSSKAARGSALDVTVRVTDKAGNIITASTIITIP